MTSVARAQPEVVALFVSDVHLQPAMPRTSAAFLDFLEHHARRAQQLFLLGDMFEYWAGDDDCKDAYHADIIAALRAVSDAGVQVHWLAGNRDFLVGHDFAKACGLRILPEPHVTSIAGRKLVLVHGDAQCIDDHAYMRFRAQVRDPAWQTAFLARPLGERKAIIDGMRSGSREAQRGKSYDIMDVNCAAIEALFESTGAEVMIHGHTHRPAMHQHQVANRDRIRHVLPDWDCESSQCRGGWIALHADGTLRTVAVQCAAAAKRSQPSRTAS